MVYINISLVNMLSSVSLITIQERRLTDAALNQDAVRDAPVVIVLSAVYERTTGKYGERGIKYVHMEIGFAAQNIYLQADIAWSGDGFYRRVL